MIFLKPIIRRYHKQLHTMRQKDPSIDMVRSGRCRDKKKPFYRLHIHLFSVPVHTDQTSFHNLKPLLGSILPCTALICSIATDTQKRLHLAPKWTCFRRPLNLSLSGFHLSLKSDLFLLNLCLSAQSKAEVSSEFSGFCWNIPA